MAKGFGEKKIGGNQWVRVNGAPLRPQDDERNEQNINRLKSTSFKNACKVAGINPTKRQASKWNNLKGAAYKLANKIAMNGYIVPEAV